MTQRDEAPDAGADEYIWLDRVLLGTIDGQKSRYLARPSASEPHLLLPLEPTAVTAAALRRHHDARTPKEKVTGLVAELVGRAGLARFAGGEVVERAPFRLVQQLADTLGEPDVIASVAIGPPRRNRKPVIQLLRPNGSVVGFVKVGWSTLTRELVTNEAARLKNVAGRLPAPLTAPTVIAELSTDDTDVVVTSPLSVTPSAKAPPPLGSDVVLALARCRDTQRLPVADLGTIADMRSSSKPLPIDVAQLVARHDGVELEAGIWHGDLTPWNMATSPTEVMVWDWEFAGLNRPVGFDLLHGAFEQVRRAAPNNEQVAVETVLAEAPAILRPVRGAAMANANLEAYRDLYLAELITRETRLSGEGWTPSNLGPLDQVATDALKRRLSL